MRFTLSRAKKLWLVVIFAVLLSAILVFLSGCTVSYLTQPPPIPDKQPENNPAPEAIEVEKDYTDVAVSGLPVEEQIKIVRCVKLSSIVNWGEGGPMYSKEVAQAFMLDYPQPDFLAQLEEEFGRYEHASGPSEDQVAFLTQHTADETQLLLSLDNAYWREIWFYTDSDTIQIHLVLDSDMNIIRSWAFRMTNDYPWSHPFNLYTSLGY